MKALVLLAAAALALSGCELFGLDCSFDSVPTREQGLDATITAALPDTVVVAFVETPLFPSRGYSPVGADAGGIGADSVRVRGSLTTQAETPDLSARLDVRGDTVFVSLDAPLVRRACSPPPAPGEGFLRLDLPRGVVVRQLVIVPQGPPRASAPLVSDPFRPLLRA